MVKLTVFKKSFGAIPLPGPGPYHTDKGGAVSPAPRGGFLFFQGEGYA